MCMVALTAATAVFQAMGAMQQANAQSAEYKAQAAYNRRQATIERLKGHYEATRQREQGERVFAKQHTAYAASGVTMEGTPTDIILDSVAENELDVAAIKWGQTLAGQNYDYEAKINKMNARSAKQGGYFAALTPLLKGATEIAGMYQKSQAPA